jgi:levanase/fructan beta-fructosidase
MRNEILLQSNYLLIPIAREQKYETISFFINEEKIFEFQIPIMNEENNFEYQYKAPVPVAPYIGRHIRIEGNYSEIFFHEISQSDIIPINNERRPIIHFTANTGWMNDPNGLIYKNGIYHLYFQYNPFDTKWENMCWGHAISKDLLHWEQKETVLYPDQDGPIFSGSGIVNENTLLGLPKDAHIYFYTSAGGKSEWSKDKLPVQKIAYSVDDGNTLHKKDGCIVEHICDENRDPKVYWHEQSKAYIMLLYLTNNDYAILRSVDLENWSVSQTLTLDKAWECPDFLEVPIVGGGTKWMFWSADGFYFLGDFDGYIFKTDGIRRDAYKTTLPYAAQTFWGVNDRIVSIPWIRSLNKNKLYTGAMGIPRELMLIDSNHQLVLSQLPIREWKEQKVLQYAKDAKDEKITYYQEYNAVVEVGCDFADVKLIEWYIFETQILYNSITGILSVGEIDTFIGTGVRDISILVDSEIMEVTANNGTIYAVYELEKDYQNGTIAVTVEGKGRIEIFQIN